MRTLYANQHQSIIFDQSENSVLGYTVDWEVELDGATVSTSAWSTEDSGLTLASAANTTKVATVDMSGDPGAYRAVNKITDSAGDTHERFIDIIIRDNSLEQQSDDYGHVVIGC